MNRLVDPQTMMHSAIVFVLTAALAAMAGCEPYKRIVWSPDGSAAVVLGHDGLRLCDAQGKLSAVIAKDATRPAWFGDSRRFIVVRTEQVATWSKLEGYLPAKARQKAIADAETMQREVLAYGGDWDKFEMKASPADVIASIMYLVEKYPKEMSAKVGEKKWKEAQAATHPIHLVEMYESTGELSAKPAIAMTRFLQDVHDVRPAPDGGAFACAVSGDALAGEDPNAISLLAGPVKEGAPMVRVAAKVATGFDWSPDGRNMVYAIANAGKAEGSALSLGSLARRAVRDSAGNMLAEPGKQEDLAGLIFQQMLQVRCLRGGRILFAAGDVRLPATAKDMPERLSLFALDPNAATVYRLVPRSAESRIGERVDLFEPSPDGTMVSIPGLAGRVTVLTLATGEVNVVQDDREPKDEILRTVPLWRSAGELCFAVPPNSKHATKGCAEIVLWSAKGVRVISKDWPGDVTTDWLKGEGSPTTAATKPAR